MLSGTARDGERPATFRDVLASAEFRAIYAASTLSWVGDYLARAAITALVFHQTGSVAISAAAFAISYAPWVIGGPVLASLAERYPYRTVMVLCDVARMVIMCLVALPRVPLPAVLVLLLASALFAPPFEAARSATLPTILAGDRYVVGLALHTSTSQPAQVAGYVLGSALAGSGNPRTALLINAGTFAVSALLLYFGTRLRQPALAPARRTHLLGETADGFRVVFTNPARRSLVLLVFGASLFVVVPEGLGAAWAGTFTTMDRGLAQGMIMGAVPLGSILGALTVTRFVAPATRRRLLRPLGLAVPLALVPAVLSPPLIVVTILAGLSGFAIGAAAPIANGQFVQALPDAYRARAFGVVQAGLNLLQGGAVLLTGLLARSASVPVVVGLWSLAGVGLMLMLAVTWPSQRTFAAAAQAPTTAHAQPATSPATPRVRRAARHAAGSTTAEVPEAL